MNNIEFKRLILEADYYTKYEPIIKRDTLEVFAYEALSKFDIRNELIDTEEIFKKLHHSNKLFFELEKRNKKYQIDNFPYDKKLFVNFDADIFVSEEQKDYWSDFLLKYKDKLVIEITENGNDDEVSAQIIKDFSNWLSDKNIESAFDDFAQEGAMFSFHIMNNCKYIKIDKSFLKQIKMNMNYIYYLKGVLQTINLNGQKSIIEGVETEQDLEIVKSLACDYIQGYYFDNLVKII